jgi:hypothetical protein
VWCRDGRLPALDALVWGRDERLYVPDALLRRYLCKNFPPLKLMLYLVW